MNWTIPRAVPGLFEDTRLQIVSLLLERAATTSELAQVLNRPRAPSGATWRCSARPDWCTWCVPAVQALEAKKYTAAPPGCSSTGTCTGGRRAAAGARPGRVEIARQPVAAAPAAGRPPRPVIGATNRLRPDPG
ncbi:MAG: hypothetical protein R2719_12535 [Micropruina sp.]